MLKLAQKYNYVFLIFVALIFVGCEDGKNLKSAINPTLEPSYNNPIDFLNAIRNNSGLNTLYLNEKLSQTSLNHAKYTFKNDIDSHDEINTNDFFTGETPQQRAYFVGYSSQIKENLSINAIDSILSIEGLMSAIYHRFAFLDPNINEIGYGSFGDSKYKNYVYTMGNSKLEQFCQRGISDKGYGKFYSGFCMDKKINISEKNYNNLKYLNYYKYIYYPNSDNTKAFFSKEIPDPIPECKITANPISIEFNNQNTPVDIISFKLFKDDLELTNTKLITKSNDVNFMLNEFQFVLFSEDVFEFNTEYLAVFKYLQNSQEKEISWKFKTKTPQNKYFIANDGDRLALLPNTWYDIFINPQDCNDVFSTYQASYKLMKKPDIQIIDANMIRVRLNGLKNSKLTLSLDGSKNIYLVLTKSSDSLKIYENKFIYIFFAVILIALFFILRRR